MSTNDWIEFFLKLLLKQGKTCRTVRPHFRKGSFVNRLGAPHFRRATLVRGYTRCRK